MDRSQTVLWNSNIQCLTFNWLTTYRYLQTCENRHSYTHTMFIANAVKPWILYCFKFLVAELSDMRARTHTHTHTHCVSTHTHTHTHTETEFQSIWRRPVLIIQFVNYINSMTIWLDHSIHFSLLVVWICQSLNYLHNSLFQCVHTHTSMWAHITPHHLPNIQCTFSSCLQTARTRIHHLFSQIMNFGFKSIVI